ncbi:MAG: 16S rRNA (cytosine(1402)-N(4))-methyltransferase RsmH [Anaerolineae bacterium]|nr:16S rRNA (cytosine(1402)-N(4))-methyltransferase RsmH [Anaerolineae bacterium]
MHPNAGWYLVRTRESGTLHAHQSGSTVHRIGHTVNDAQPHIPVLLSAVLEGLRAHEVGAGAFVDGTLGAGGHAEALLDAALDARLLGLDRDPVALALSRVRLSLFGTRVTLRHASYEQIGEFVPRWLGPDSDGVDGILLDLGMSSMQVDNPTRGFSFMQDGPLDMRFDPETGGISASDIVNTWTQRELADILYKFGEERHSRRLARAIIAARPLHTTRQLAEVIASAQPKKRGPRPKIHPATRTFQALRIAVNDELGTIERTLPVAISLLRPGGRLAVISFHSLEDRIVKQTFKTAATDCICPPKQPVCTCEHVAQVKLITRKPATAAPEESSGNPRSRSAKLRVIERLPSSPAS